MKNLSIRFKLFGGIGVIVLLLIVNSVVASQMMRNMSAANAKARINSQLEHFLTEREVDHLAWVNLLSEVFRTGQAFTGQLDHTKCGLGSWYYEFIQSGDYKDLPRDIQKLFEEIEEPHRHLHETAKRINEEVKQGAGLAGAQAIYEQDTSQYLKTVRGLLADVNKKLSEQSSELVANAGSSEKLAFRILLIVTVIAGLLGSAVALILGKAITSPINAVVNMLKNMAQSGGDLTQRITISSSDEVGALAQWFNAFVAELQEMIKKLKVSIENIASSSQELSAAVEESNASMEEVTAVVESQVAVKAQEIAARSQTTLQEAQATQSAADEGDKAVQQMASVINSIEGSTKETSIVITQLETTSKEIGVIIETIKGIADQTNLLALNAAIEAARAGESGRGFAVVAEEVRKLAENSNKAGDAIVQLIHSVQSQVQNAVNKMASNVVMVQTGQDVAAKTREILKNVREIASREAMLVNEMSAAAMEQAASAQEISASTEEQVGILSQISGTASQLAQMADQLNALVGGFTT